MLVPYSNGSWDIAVQQCSYRAVGNQPGDIGLRDPDVRGWAQVFPRAFLLSGVAAAGLAVSLLTQSVWETVIPEDRDTEWHWDMERASGSDRKDEKKTKSANQSIFHICMVLRWQYLISVFCESACLPPPSLKVPRVRWVIFRWYTVTRTCPHTSQLSGFQWGVWADAGSCQVAAIRASNDVYYPT